MKYLQILPVFLLFSFICSSAFDTVVQNASDKNTKAQLIFYKKGGIEKKVNKSTYKIKTVIAEAKSYLKTPHNMGGKSKAGIDCSGLIMMSHKKQGIILPRSCQEQARFGTIIAHRSQLKEGDILYFHNSYKTKNFITHAGIYLGNDQFIHVSSNRGVEIITLTSSTFWNSRYLFATRMHQ